MDGIFEMARKNNARVVSVDFRNKKDFGWRDHIETVTFDNGKSVSSEIFKTLFYGHNILRPSCYECPYKSTMHPGDITIADYWGIENAAPEFDDNKGVSLVLVNNQKGEHIFENIQESLTWKATRIEDSMQPPLVSPFPEPKERKQFWDDFYNLNFGKITKRYGGADIKNTIKSKLRMIKRKLIK